MRRNTEVFQAFQIAQPRQETGSAPKDGFPRLSWLGWQDLNLRMPESKSGALPLGDIPIWRLDAGHTGYYSMAFGKMQEENFRFGGFLWGKGGRGIRD